MAGGFLPPVVTTLDGNIDPLLAELAKAKAAIRALKSEGFTIPINVKLNEASLAGALGKIKAIGDNGVTIRVKAEPDIGSVAGSLAGMQGLASANPIKVRLEVDKGGFFISPTAVDNAFWAGKPMTGSYGGFGSPVGMFGNNGGGGGGTTFLPFPWFPRGAGGRVGGGGGGGLAGFAAGWASSMPFQNYPTRTYGLPFGWGNVGYTGLHSGLLGLGALGMGAVGGVLGLGSMAAVYGNSVMNTIDQVMAIRQSVLAAGGSNPQILRALGIRGGGPLGSAIAQSQGMVTTDFGLLTQLFNRRGPLAGLIANTGVAGGIGFNNWLAGFVNRANSGGSSLAKAFGTTTMDATNIAAGIGNIAAFAGHTFAHMPGEIEWLTTAFRNTTGWANDLWHVPVLKSILGGGIMGAALLHVAFNGMHLGGGLFNLLGRGVGGAGKILSKIPGLGRIAGFTGPMANGLIETGGGMAAMGIGALPVLAAAATLAAGLSIYRYASPTQAAIYGIDKNLYGVGTGKFGNNALRDLGLFTAGARSNSHTDWITSNLNGLFGFGSSPAAQTGNAFSWTERWLTPQQQNADQARQLVQSFIGYGSSINAVANALHIKPAQAANIMAMAGVQMGKNGQITGGNARAVQLARAYFTGNGILNPSWGEFAANIGVGNLVSSPQWKAAAQVSANWDAYFGAQTGGIQGYNGLLTALAGNPSFEKANAMASILKSPTGLIPTGAAIQSAAMPMMDFFRQAQSVGAISGKGLQSTFVSLAQSMVPMVGNSKAAQAMLVELANSGGADIKTFSQLKSANGGWANGLKATGQALSSTMIAMAKMPAIASQVQTGVTNAVSAMTASILAKSHPAAQAFDQMSAAALKFGWGSKQAAAFSGSLATQLLKNKMPAQAVIDLLKQLHINLNLLPANVKKELHIVTNAKQANQDINGAANAWKNFPNGQSKTNYIITAYRTTGYAAYAALNSGSSGGAKPGLPNGMANHGRALGGTINRGEWSWVGENGPEMMYLPGGASIIPHNQTGQYMGGAHGCGGGDTHVHVYIDSKELFGAMKTQTFKFNNANGNRAKGGRVRGTMAPRN